MQGEKDPRDIQFANFAKMLALDVEEITKLSILLRESVKETNQRIHLLYARRAYDLVAHTLTMKGFDADEEYIPDMKEWPDK